MEIGPIRKIVEIPDPIRVPDFMPEMEPNSPVPSREPAEPAEPKIPIPV